MLAKKSDISSKGLEICMIIYKCGTDKNSFAGTNRKEVTEQNMINLFLWIFQFLSISW